MIQSVALAMRGGLTIHDLATQLFPYLPWSKESSSVPRLLAKI